ncbi:MAG TPA: acyl-CoA dehydrogenase family protein [Dehalococcoidia bacterium]|nr:acyl-CoA dehydrogenase family protein [Dehalococcoidia bacterium]
MIAVNRTTHKPTDDHPLLLKAREFSPRVRDYSDAIDRERKLPTDLVDKMREAGFFHALLPRDLGGQEADPVTAGRIVEEIARGDGSAGWCVMLAAQSCSFAGFIPKEDAIEVYGNGGIVAGTARPIGRAVATRQPADGFIVSGRWPFASGSSHATWFAGECVVYDGEKPRLDANGNEVSRMCFFPASETKIIDTWDTIGLRGTASNDFSTEGTFVPASRGFQVLVTEPVHSWPLYRFEPLVFINHGTHALGVARGAIDSAIDVAMTKHGWGGVMMKDVPRMQAAIAEATALVDSAASYLYDTSWRLWQGALGGENDVQLRAAVRLATSHAMKASLQAVDGLHAAVATTGIFNASPISRQFRDIHTASAHVMIGTMTIEAAGRIILGDEAGFPFF